MSARRAEKGDEAPDPEVEGSSGPEADDWEPAASGIYCQLRDEIIDGRLAPATIISEPTLSRRFGVSRAPLREAIWRLEGRGLLVRPPRQRARVASVSAADVAGIFSLREVVEGLAAREAARHITDGELAGLRAALDRQADETRRGESGDGERFDFDFHAAIAGASRNGFVVRFLCEEYHALIALCRRRQRRDPARSARSRLEHARIVDALADRDPDLAELQMRRHVENARQALLADPAAFAGTPVGRRPGQRARGR